MRVVNITYAKANFSELVNAVESGGESEIVITRNGKPAARLVPLTRDTRARIGLFQGKYPPMSLEDLNASNAEIERLFYGSDD